MKHFKRLVYGMNSLNLVLLLQSRTSTFPTSSKLSRFGKFRTIDIASEWTICPEITRSTNRSNWISGLYAMVYSFFNTKEGLYSLNCTLRAIAIIACETNGSCYKSVFYFICCLMPFHWKKYFFLYLPEFLRESKLFN